MVKNGKYVFITLYKKKTRIISDFNDVRVIY
jgi:hypothetical protein